VIGPGGVVVIDSKQYRGRLQLDHYGMLWHGRHLLVSALRKVRWEADQADEVLGIAEVQVAAVVAVHGSSVPWGCVDTDGVTVIPARRYPTCCRRCRRCLGLSGWPGWPTGTAFDSAPPPNTVGATARAGWSPWWCLPSLNVGLSQPRPAQPVRCGHGQALLRMAESRAMPITNTRPDNL
jgi:hypothetical protein